MILIANPFLADVSTSTTNTYCSFFIKEKLQPGADGHNNILVVYVIAVEKSLMFVLLFLTLGFGGGYTGFITGVGEFGN